MTPFHQETCGLGSRNFELNTFPVTLSAPAPLQQLNEDEFLPFLFTLEDEYQGSNVFEGRPPTMAKFCANQVEAIGKEADHVQIAALSRCLKVSLDVAYLSRTGAPPETPLAEDAFAEDDGPLSDSTTGAAPSQALEVPGQQAQIKRARDDPTKCDIVHFEIPGAVAHIDIGTLLFRPGHYDVLINAPPPASPEIVIPKVA